MYKYIHTHIHTYIHTYTYIHTHTHTHIHTYIHNTHIHTYTYIHTYIHTHTHTYIHTYIHTSRQDGGRRVRRIENALNLIVSTAERSGNMKKEMKQTIFETVSTLRDLNVQLKTSRDSKSQTIRDLEGRVASMKAELEATRGTMVKVHRETSSITIQEPARVTAKAVAPPGEGWRKIFSVVRRT